MIFVEMWLLIAAIKGSMRRMKPLGYMDLELIDKYIETDRGNIKFSQSPASPVSAGWKIS